MPKNTRHNQDNSGQTTTQTRSQVKRPSLYRVILVNDDYTTMEFVIEVLQRFFQKSHDEASYIMLQVHYQGQGTCGFYPFEIAETKVKQVIDHARHHEFPLQCTLEEA